MFTSDKKQQPTWGSYVKRYERDNMFINGLHHKFYDAVVLNDCTCCCPVIFCCRYNHSKTQRNILLFYNQLRLLFVVSPPRRTATCIHLSLIKTAACFALWSFHFYVDATPDVLQSAFVHAFVLSLIMFLLFLVYFTTPI